MKRTTIVDVGRLAGVSAKTVSRVLNDEPHVSAAVKQRVRAAADALDYHPNVFAQALVRRKSHMIGLVYENPSPSYVVELQKGVLERLINERYRLVVIPIRSVQENAAEVVGLLRSAALDGVVLAPPASDHPLILNQLKEARIRCARIAPTRMIEAAPSNLVDDVAAAREIAAYVIGLGHREIAIIRGDPTHPSTEARMLGYMQAFHQAGLDLRFDRIEPGMFTFDSGLAAGRNILARADRPTAILAQNDDMAVGAMMAAREIGLSIPERLSIVGFDDSEVSRITWPRLTTVRQPVFEMAVAATEMVIAQLEDREPLARVLHHHTLLIRESAAPPHA
ncbi:LacI family DNA-binding transcriptional regulator [Sphingomonas echinoides]|jgi:LacI family transcriptional regulator|uniref:LacI family DNA-binding transcriptional regulator n=2 Tax=Pseudomonadota TaxID=1224 RepID=A0ABU4PPJ9_9SPHN|nr:LacI family DNA-binding transcriptional regulator [Sphingomonas echinoides]MDX5985329.1 LacI family DNA-binding transcriptional regulator [Sphingomonas echinoides]